MRGHFLLFDAGFDNAIDAHFSVTGTPVFALQIHAATGDFGAAQFSSLKQFQAQFHDNQNNANENNEARQSYYCPTPGLACYSSKRWLT